MFLPTTFLGTCLTYIENFTIEISNPMCVSSLNNFSRTFKWSTTQLITISETRIDQFVGWIASSKHTLKTKFSRAPISFKIELGVFSFG